MEADPPAGEWYLLLADISGYTGFMSDVERAHGVDFSTGIPAAYSVLGALLHAVIAFGGLQDCCLQFPDTPERALRKACVDGALAALGVASRD